MTSARSTRAGLAKAKSAFFRPMMDWRLEGSGGVAHPGQTMRPMTETIPLMTRALIALERMMGESLTQISPASGGGKDSPAETLWFELQAPRR